MYTHVKFYRQSFQDFFMEKIAWFTAWTVFLVICNLLKLCNPVAKSIVISDGFLWEAVNVVHRYVFDRKVEMYLHTQNYFVKKNKIIL
jgi:hypothetical protein